jgi:transcriptional regulator with XRE-family HTH domain
MDINQRLAQRIHQLRGERGLSIEELAARSGVSRAMISRIERVESSPTATVLNKLAMGFGMLLPELFGPHGYGNTRLHKPDPVASRRNQAEWTDPATGYRRRTLTPATAAQPLQLSEIRFPAGKRVTFENAFGASLVHQQIWMLQGHLEITLGREPTRLAAGDCMAMTLDRPITFHNPGVKDARYVVAVLRKP